MIAARQHLSHHGKRAFTLNELHRLAKLIPIAGKFGAIFKKQARDTNRNPNGSFKTALEFTVDMCARLF